MAESKHILLIVTGSIAAYKALELVRLLRRAGHRVTGVLTDGGSQFITPLSLSSLTGEPTYTDLFSLKDEVEMGHIRLVREADTIVVAPASADLLAKMATGQADDLASTLLLVANPADIPVMVAPAMNHGMWSHPATQRNIIQLQKDGVQVIAPEAGELACGETGDGRMADIATIADRLMPSSALAGKRFIVTGGATREAIDPVRYITNHSSGKQAVAIAKALQAHGAQVHLVHGAMQVPIPGTIDAVPAMTALAMRDAVEQLLPVDGIICAAAVSDWQMANPSEQKLKKRASEDTLTLTLQKTPDILYEIAHHPTRRPALVVGFAAETQDVVAQAMNKRERKGCDWIVANDVAGGAVFGQDSTHAALIDAQSQDDLGTLSKTALAETLTQRIIDFFTNQQETS